MTESQEPARDLASSLLDRARGGDSRAPSTSRRRRATGEPVYSGPGPDERDPVTVANAVAAFVDARDWRERTRMAAAIANWDRIAGPDIAAHVVAEGFDSGVLSLQADSTAWATQVRLLMPMVRRRVDAEVGVGVVTEIVVRGPAAPARRGGWRVKGRGPRDDYG